MSLAEGPSRGMKQRQPRGKAKNQRQSANGCVNAPGGFPGHTHQVMNATLEEGPPVSNCLPVGVLGCTLGVVLLRLGALGAPCKGALEDKGPRKGAAILGWYWVPFLGVRRRTL